MIPHPPKKFVTRPRAPRSKTAFAPRRRIRVGPAANDNHPTFSRSRINPALILVTLATIAGLYWIFV